MISANQAREKVQNYVESDGNFHIAKIEELVIKAAEVGKYSVSYKPEGFLDPEIRDYITAQILSAGFQANWDESKTKIIVNWRKG